MSKNTSCTEEDVEQVIKEKEIISSPADKRKYFCFELPNGLECLLIDEDESHPDPTAAVSLRLLELALFTYIYIYPIHTHT